MFDGQAIKQECRALPQGAVRMNALQRAIRQADLAGEPFWRLMFRYEYTAEATFHDDPPKAIPVSAEFSAIFEEYPDALGQGGPEMCLMVLEMGVDPCVFLPQIPTAQWESLMEKFRTLVQRYHIGLRTWYWQACRFYAYTNLEQAKDCFERFWNTGRDNLSDCNACERSGAVWFSLFCGNREQAQELAKPLLDGSLTCSDVPQTTHHALLEDALNRMDWQAAAPLAEALYQKGNRDRNDLSFLGAVLRCWADSDPNRGAGLLQKRLSWALSMWDQKKRFDFFLGAWLVCRSLSEKEKTVQWKLPKKFSLYRPDGVYQTAELAGWFYRQTTVIAEQFDVRNGTPWFSDRIKAADARRTL